MSLAGDLQPLLLGIDYLDPDWLLHEFGGAFIWVSLVIVFVECGLFFPFLPGDTLLFALGLFIAGDDYHVFGCLWDTDDTVAIFVDGVMIKKWKYKWVYGDGTDAAYAHVLLNLSVGGQWAGRYGIDNDAFPQSFSVDYVRVYQKAGEKKTGVSTTGHDLLDKPTTQPSTQPAEEK